MKKAFTILNFIALLGLCATFTSCEHDEDVHESMVISGQWTGNWGMYYTYQYRGRLYTFDSYDTDIVFYPDYDYATHGYGYQVDFYDFGPYSKLSYRFTWRIDNGIIRMYYPGYPEYNTSIRDYRLSNSRFTGYFDTGTEPFTLRKIADYYDWRYYYDWDYHYWYSDHWDWGYYYYSNTRGTADSDTITADTLASEGRIVKIGSRLAELQ